MSSKLNLTAATEPWQQNLKQSLKTLSARQQRLSLRFNQYHYRFISLINSVSPPPKRRHRRFLDIFGAATSIYNFARMRSLSSKLTKLRNTQTDLTQQTLITARLLNLTNEHTERNNQAIQDLAFSVQNLTRNYNHILRYTWKLHHTDKIHASIQKYASTLSLLDSITQDFARHVTQLETAVGEGVHHKLSQYLVPYQQAHSLITELNNKLPAQFISPYYPPYLASYYETAHVTIIPATIPFQLTFLIEAPIHDLKQHVDVSLVTPIPKFNPRLQAIAVSHLPHSYIGISHDANKYTTFKTNPLNNNPLQLLPDYTKAYHRRLEPICLSELFFQDHRPVKCMSQVHLRNTLITHIAANTFYYTANRSLALHLNCYGNNTLHPFTDTTQTIQPNSLFQVQDGCIINADVIYIYVSQRNLFTSSLSSSPNQLLSRTPSIDPWSSLDLTQFPLVDQMNDQNIQKVISDTIAFQKEDLSVPITQVISHLRSVQHDLYHQQRSRHFIIYAVISVTITLIVSVNLFIYHKFGTKPFKFIINRFCPFLNRQQQNQRNQRYDNVQLEEMNYDLVNVNQNQPPAPAPRN